MSIYILYIFISIYIHITHITHTKKKDAPPTPAAELAHSPSSFISEAGLTVGMSSLAAGMAIGVVGDAGVRANAQQPGMPNNGGEGV